MKEFPDLSPLWWLGSIGLIYLGKYLAPELHANWPVLFIISWVCFCASLVLIGWSVLWFSRKNAD
jgi:hypothetical protein